MAYKLGDLVVRITGDNTDFKKKAGETKQQAEDTGKRVGKSFDLMKVKTLAMGVAGTAVFVKTIGFLKDSAMAAINAQETFSKFDVVFGGMGTAAENAAKQFQESFGLAEVTAKKMLSSTGDLLTGMGMAGESALNMSVQVNTLASDLASFTNYSGGAEGAADALTKALLGERESVKALGIVIREEDVQNRLAAAGKDKLTGAAMLQAKAEATLQIAMEQSKNAIGDYARTSDSAANTLKRAGEETKELQIAIGRNLSPSVAYLGKLWGIVASSLADSINNANELRNASEAVEKGQATSVQLLSVIEELEQRILDGRAADSEYNREILAGLRAQLFALQQTERVEYIKTNELQKQTELAEKRAKQSEEEANRQQEEKARLQAIADAREAIYDEFLAQTAQLN